MENELQDKSLFCVDCDREFIWTAGEQQFYRSKQLSEPKRCLACRKKRSATLVPDEEVKNEKR